jgi:hypothetical protein
MSHWIEDILYVVNENNRLSHIVARGFLFIMFGAIYVAVFHRGALMWTVPIALVSAAIAVGLYYLGEKNEEKEIAEHRQRLRTTARR